MTNEMKKRYIKKHKMQRIENHHFMKKMDLKFKAALGVGLSWIIIEIIIISLNYSVKSLVKTSFVRKFGCLVFFFYIAFYYVAFINVSEHLGVLIIGWNLETYATFVATI